MPLKARENKSKRPANFSSHIRWCEIEGSIIVLDILCDAYFALDQETSRAWIAYTKDDVPLPVKVAEAFDRNNWLHQTSLKTACSDPPVQVGLSKSRWFLGIISLVSARWMLKRHGFSQAYQSAAMWTNINSVPSTSINDDLKRFLAAEAWLPSFLGDRDCLPRSLALFTYLRRLGHPVSHVIGVSRFPFDAHAWVEYDGTPLLEYEVEQKLLPNARIPKGRTPIAIIV
ncbi:MAG: lasso peptide biosynthesis B2 protein [Arenicellales bacterium]